MCASCVKLYYKSARVRTRNFCESGACDKHLPWFVGFTHVRVLIPSAVRIVDASQAIVVSPSAHYKIDLLYPMIRRDVESLVLLRDLHRLYRFARRDVENVE